MEYNYLISQSIGLIAFIISLVAYHKNKKEKILGNMIISNILNIIHYLLLKAYSGCITKIIAILRDLFIIIKNKYNKLSSYLFLVIFIFIYLITAIITYDGIWSLFPILAATIYLIPIWNGNELIIKKTAFFSYFLWLIYNICIISIAGIISNIISIISILIAIKNENKAKKI